MGVRDHQVHPVQTTGFQTREEVLPELEGLTLADRGTEHLASPGRRHPGRHHQRLGDHVGADADLAERGITEHIRKLGMSQRTAAEFGDLGV